MDSWGRALEILLYDDVLLRLREHFHVEVDQSLFVEDCYIGNDILILIHRGAAFNAFRFTEFLDPVTEDCSRGIQNKKRSEGSQE